MVSATLGYVRPCGRAWFASLSGFRDLLHPGIRATLWTYALRNLVRIQWFVTPWEMRDLVEAGDS